MQSNIKNQVESTLHIFETGCAHPRFSEPQYPDFPLDPFIDPVIKALYVVGAIQISKAGLPVIDPTPSVLLRGVVRLALPADFLFGLVNAVRTRRGSEPLQCSDFDAINKELFQAIRQGFQDALGDAWFTVLTDGAYIAERTFILPVTNLRHSQEFYELGINVYQDQSADAKVYTYSTTSGIVIPREFYGDDKKNKYRYTYFTDGILGKTSCPTVYQWERYRTAKALAAGYDEQLTAKAKESYVKQACDILARFTGAANLTICEVDHFSMWKNWCSIIGPHRQQLSVRDEKSKGAVGHGVLFDSEAFLKRKDLLNKAACFLNRLGQGPRVPFDFFQHFGPACMVLASGAEFLGEATSRIANLLIDPPYRRCQQSHEKEGNHLIKQKDKVLSKKNVRVIVESLIKDGERILSTERLFYTAPH